MPVAKLAPSLRRFGRGAQHHAGTGLHLVQRHAYHSRQQQRIQLGFAMQHFARNRQGQANYFALDPAEVVSALLLEFLQSRRHRLPSLIHRALGGRPRLRLALPDALLPRRFHHRGQLVLHGGLTGFAAGFIGATVGARGRTKHGRRHHRVMKVLYPVGKCHFSPAFRRCTHHPSPVSE